MPFNYIDTLISQYANSPRLFQLIDDINTYLDQTLNTDNFYSMLWDISTAQGVGLDIWGKIVGVNRVLPIIEGEFFGFEEAGNLVGGRFGTAPFYSGGSLTSNYALSDGSYRVLILAKAYSNISDGSIASINQTLLAIFPGRGKCYVIDNENMTMIYKFEFTLTPVEQSIVVNSGVLPRPSGVEVSYSY
jgi:hypothetical protein